MEVHLLLLILCFGYMIYSLFKSIKRPKNFPPGPKFMPWMGNTMQLRKEAVASGGQHLAFEKWSKEHNSKIVGLKLGNDLAVVVLSYPLVRDVHLSEVFEGRPDNFFLRLRTMGTRMGITCTDGNLWHEHRNFAMKNMRYVGYGRNQMDQHIEAEANELLDFIDSKDGEPMWPGSFLATSVMNVLWTLAAGKRFERSDKQLTRLLDLLNRRSKVFDMCGGVLSSFPWVRHIAPDRTGYNLIRELNQELHAFFMETINEHKANMSPDNEGSDLIFAYIREMQEKTDESSTFNETQLTMTILDFFIGGSQTTSINIDLALLTLALHPDIQQLVYDEINLNLNKMNDDTQVGSRISFPYIDAFIMEVQRYYHIIPITGPRRALWDTTLGGYTIPKNTTILIGLGAVHMDKEHWEDPDNFRPERFLDAEGKIIKNEFFMPYGQGRRRCLGDALARSCLFTFLVKIVQNYQIRFAEGEKPSMPLQPGILLSPKPYNVRFIKRN